MDRAAAEQKTAELVAEYGSADACPGVLLCDRHPGEAVAFTVVEPDLSYRDLTFGELGELSARFAANLAALADADENYFFLARDDDVIIMAGYRIGPFDVESVLVTHDQVIEAAVIGVPDELRGEVIEAFVVLRDPRRGTEELASELQQLVKDKFAAHAYPRRVHFVDALPKTPSGKVQRYLLRQQRAETATPSSRGTQPRSPG